MAYRSDVVSIAQEVISDNRYMVLSTSLEYPWAAALFYAVDSECNFYFISAKDSRHARYIAQNAVVSIAIFNTRSCQDEVKGVQLTGNAKVLGIKKIPHAIDVLYRKLHPDSSIRMQHRRTVKDFIGGSMRNKFERRFYRISPFRLFLFTITRSKDFSCIEIGLDELVDVCRMGK